MDKGLTIVGTSAFEPVALRAPQYELISIFQPSLYVALRLQRLLSAASLFIVLRTYFLAATTLATTAVVAKFVAVWTFWTAKTAILGTGKGIATVYKTKTVRRIRKKLEFEMAMLILGPGTNTMIVVVFWPGWWLVIGLAVAAKLMAA